MRVAVDEPREDDVVRRPELLGVGILARQPLVPVDGDHLPPSIATAPVLDDPPSGRSAGSWIT